LLYVSGDSRKLKNTVWMLSDWVRLIRKVRETVDLPIVIVGAGFDSWVHERIAPLLTMYKIPFQIQTDLPISELCYVVNKAELLIGYQSGISILAAHLDTKQLMVYFNGLVKMKNKWVKPANRNNGIFNYCWFNTSIDQAYDILKSSGAV
jgi:ADP-heptose:LPS heptosyltransferase